MEASPSGPSEAVDVVRSPIFGVVRLTREHLPANLIA